VHRKTQDLVDLIKESRAVFSSFAKAKSAKLGMFVRQQLFNMVNDITDLQ
jgi:26S proteasome regulatory subunit N6